MTSIYPYVPEVKRFYYCKKGNNHAQQALNTICLDPICLQSPLICSTCVSELHKYHKTIPLSIFLSDYQGAIKKNNIKQSKKRIRNQHSTILQNVQEFKINVIQKLEKYIERINEYFRFLQKSLHIREQLQRSLNLTLDPQALSKSTSSEQQLSQSVSFIIKNSLFNQQNRITNISSILKYDESRNLALLDKIMNQNVKYQMQIDKCLQKLDFVKQTMGNQSINLKQRLAQFNSTYKQDLVPISLPMTDSKIFVDKQSLFQTLSFNTAELFNLKDQQKHLNNLFSLQKQLSTRNVNENPIFQFHQRQKHEMLNISDGNKSVIKSNITALKPQYALICPSVDYMPRKEQNWSIKIINCRNFASKNTLAIGLCTLQNISINNFQERYSPNNSQNQQYLVTSQGYILKNAREEKTEFRFSSGDTIHLEYDPYYRLITFSKDNGKKLTIKLNSEYSSTDNKLYGCVRLTYASDQVQIINHTFQK